MPTRILLRLVAVATALSLPGCLVMTCSVP